MDLSNRNIGYGITGSFCTFAKTRKEIQRLTEMGAHVIPIFSYQTQNCDTRFGTAKEFMEEVCDITGNPGIRTLQEAEPIGVPPIPRLPSSLGPRRCYSHTPWSSFHRNRPIFKKERHNFILVKESSLQNDPNNYSIFFLEIPPIKGNYLRFIQSFSGKIQENLPKPSPFGPHPTLRGKRDGIPVHGYDHNSSVLPKTPSSLPGIPECCPP